MKVSASQGARSRFSFTSVRGGRLVKFKGSVASIAPMLMHSIQSTSCRTAAARAIPALAAPLLTLTSSIALAGTCTETGGVGSGVWTCSGAETAGDLTQYISDPAAAGPITVTTNAGFGVTTAGSYGVFIPGFPRTYTATDITFNDANMSTISAQYVGVYARGFSGSITIMTNGDVTGTDLYGIQAITEAGGQNLTISANNVTGGQFGIFSSNFGSGATTVDVTGTAEGGQTGISMNTTASSTTFDLTVNDVVGTTQDGINIQHQGSGDLSITAVNVTGGMTGIDVLNQGTGATTVTSSGTVTSNGSGTDFAIDVMNQSTASDLTIAVNNVVSNGTGIFATNNGTGDTSITAGGSITADGTVGISVDTYYSTGSLTIAANDVSAYDSAIATDHYGSGEQSITVNGTVTSDGSGIRANNFGYSTDMIISAMAVSAEYYGIRTVNQGSGVTSITAMGPVNARAYDGIRVETQVRATDVTISAGDVTGGYRGVYVDNLGTGATTIMSTGTIAGGSEEGIRVDNGTNTTGLTITVTDVSGRGSGISAQNYGTGSTNITVSGTVTGMTDYGIYTQTLADRMTTITLASGADVSGGNGVAVFNNEGDSQVALEAGSAVTGEIRLNDGDDGITLAGGDVSGATILDGGDDSSTADGFIDQLTITGPDYDLVGANLLNWESVVIDGGSAGFSDNALSVGDGAADTGLRVANGGRLNAGSMFGLTGNLALESGGEFSGTGGGAGVFTINGNTTNTGGILSTQDGAAGDVITINGDYTSDGGIVRIDTVLGDDSSATDMLAITGNSAGTGTLEVANAGGGGDVTMLGIEVITVGGTSGAVFSLAGDFTTAGGEQAVVAGAYAYTLRQESDGDWHLVSSEVPDEPTPPPVGPTPPVQPLFQPGAPIYEALPGLLLNLNAPSTLQQRHGDRLWSRSDGELVTQGSSAGRSGPSPLWMRFTGLHGDFDPSGSTTGTSYEIDTFGFQTGADVLVFESGSGRLFAGANVHYGQGFADVSSRFGSGGISTDAYGLGLSATWLDDSGFYADGQLRYSFFTSDLTSDTLGRLATSVEGDGFAASIEMGKEYQLNDKWSLTPQAQLTYNDVDFDDFVGLSSERVSLDDGESLMLRVGVMAEQDLTNATGRIGNFYGIANISYEFMDRNQVDVSGVALGHDREEWTGELGVGAEIKTSAGPTLFGELSAIGSLSDLDQAHAFRGNFGARWEF